MKKLIFSLACLFCFSGTTIFAQVNQSIPQTQKAQKHKIKQGIKSGELTKAEAKKLTVQQKNIQRTKAKAKADGVVTKKERKIIKTKQKQANKSIYRQKHDRQKQ